MIQDTEWVTREQVLHSYELIARYVRPHFQGSLVSLQNSAAWTSNKKEAIIALRSQAIERAKQDYLQTTRNA